MLSDVGFKQIFHVVSAVLRRQATSRDGSSKISRLMDLRTLFRYAELRTVDYCGKGLPRVHSNKVEAPRKYGEECLEDLVTAFDSRVGR